MDNITDDQEFLIALSYLPIIREKIIFYCEELITFDKSKREQRIELIINELVNEMQLKNVEIISSQINHDDRKKLLRTTLKQLINAQLPFSELANKIRRGKENRPSIFK